MNLLAVSSDQDVGSASECQLGEKSAPPSETIHCLKCFRRQEVIKAPRAEAV